MATEADFDRRRATLIAHLRSNGINDQRVLQALSCVPRHLFVPAESIAQAYDDIPLPIGRGQTISQPLVVGMMTQAIAPREGDLILEIGTGSGYQTAVLASLCGRVVSLEREPRLAAAATERLRELGYQNVQVHTGDGTLGWPGDAPYSGIIVTAAAPKVPPALLEQLADGGRLVIPVGSLDHQTLRVIKREGSDHLSSGLGAVRFVPLIGDQGWQLDSLADGFDL